MKTYSWFLVIALLAFNAQAQTYQIQHITNDLNYPWSLAFLPNGDFLLTERTGHLKRINQQGQVLASIPVNLPDIMSAGQGGLLDIALLPDFSESGRLLLSYVCGTAKANSVCLAIAVFETNQLKSIQPVFRARPDRRDAAHFGGRIALLPDNTLVLTLGDGFDYREEAQNPANHLGKLVRLNIDGSVPANNPLVGAAGHAAEIYSLGHRNVQGIIYDAATDTLFSHEHGPRGGDELNTIVAGKNYGWPVATHGIDYTGARVSPYTDFAGMVSPLYYWTPSIAPAGMTLYRGDLFPQWHGNIFVASLKAKSLHRLVMKGGKVMHEEVLLDELNVRLRDVRTGPDGALYLLTDSANGALIQMVPALPHSVENPQ